LMRAVQERTGHLPAALAWSVGGAIDAVLGCAPQRREHARDLVIELLRAPVEHPNGRHRR
jgi:hypothetical protein